MECDDGVLYDDRGPVNRQENTFYNHREYTAPTAQPFMLDAKPYMWRRSSVMVFLSFLLFPYRLTISPSTYGYNVTRSPI